MTMFLLSIIIGFSIVCLALFLIRREFLKAVKAQRLIFDQVKHYEPEALMDLLGDLKGSIDEMNQSFYDIANDLEGKYSIHEKQIKDIEVMLTQMKAPQSIEKPMREPFSHVIDDAAEVRMHVATLNAAAQKRPNENEEALDLVSQAALLIEEGYDMKQVAKTLGIGYGELKLMLKFKK